ncbi:hypothetical protein EVAR_10103_1 [Eumeta japonica]|uniref:Uncharacterized protein n=1 Tax=Eumeta variegata TaxID=151549 RepID=A0A4C1UDF9_EUMVA|nr:hypothetical protein EVAR_10103_1 [Eumeta japonica]
MARCENWNFHKTAAARGTPASPVCRELDVIVNEQRFRHSTRIRYARLPTYYYSWLKAVTDCHGHSHSQRGHRCFAVLLARNRIFDEGLMERGCTTRTLSSRTKCNSANGCFAIGLKSDLDERLHPEKITYAKVQVHRIYSFGGLMMSQGGRDGYGLREKERDKVIWSQRGGRDGYGLIEIGTISDKVKGEADGMDREKEEGMRGESKREREYEENEGHLSKK